jgi:hypothetical protein
MRPELKAPDELLTPMEELLSLLAERGVSKVEVFPYHRPGEQPYWLCFLFMNGQRHSVGTPDLRHLPLADQAPDLLRQLRQFKATSLLERFQALTARVSLLTAGWEQEHAVREFLENEKRIEAEERDPEGLLPLLDSFLKMDAEELTTLQAEVEASGAADQMRLFAHGEAAEPQGLEPPSSSYICRHCDAVVFVRGLRATPPAQQYCQRCAPSKAGR